MPAVQAVAVVGGVAVVLLLAIARVEARNEAVRRRGDVQDQTGPERTLDYFEIDAAVRDAGPPRVETS